MVIKRIKPMSFAKMNAVIYGLIGLARRRDVFAARSGWRPAAGADSETWRVWRATFGMIFGVGRHHHRRRSAMRFSDSSAD